MKLKRMLKILKKNNSLKGKRDCWKDNSYISRGTSVPMKHNGSNGSWEECIFKEEDVLAKDWKIIGEGFLTKKEKEYIKQVIKPFKHRVEYIEKRRKETSGYDSWSYEQDQYIVIYVRRDKKLEGYTDTTDKIKLPLFPKNTKFFGMDLEKRYTLHDLKIF